MKLCVTGGAGYIGSVVAQMLIDEGHDVCILDNLSTGHKSALPEGARLVKGDIRDNASLDDALGDGVEAVLHFAALSIVGDSVEHPLTYFDNNVGGTLSILQAMNRLGIKRFVFSSSAAVYGAPSELPIEETAPRRPTNPYGHSKLCVETMLEASNVAWDLRYVSLRYFNAGGSTEKHGEHHDPESHLIPIILDVAAGRREAFTVFGDDYDTPDGTCIRDYIHIYDLATAHVLALGAMEKRNFSGVLNLGSEEGFSVLEVIETAERVTGTTIARTIGERRSGDPPGLLASSRRAEEVLGWKKTHSSLEEIIQSAHEWRTRNPDGYPD